MGTDRGYAYLEPVGNVGVDMGSQLDAFAENVDRMGWLKRSLRHWSEDVCMANDIAGRHTTMAGYSWRA